MIKWVVNNLLYKHTPECMCGYKMKPTQTNLDDYSWKCIWKKCGWETTQTFNGTLHWKKSENN